VTLNNDLDWNIQQEHSIIVGKHSSTTAIEMQFEEGRENSLEIFVI
jgi:hypothetical protein